MTNIGDDDEQVRLILNGDEITSIYQSYEVSISVLEQPAAFSITLGDGSSARELLEQYPAKSRFEIFMGDTKIQSGEIDTPSARQDAGSGTVVSFRGRDLSRQLVDAYISREIAFQNETYFDLTLKVLGEVGLGDAVLLTQNDKTRKRFTGVNLSAKPTRDAGQIVVESGLELRGGAIGSVEGGEIVTERKAPRIVYNVVKATLGQTWWGFLQEQYKKVGLFLWVDPDGNFILAEPNGQQEAAYRIVRERGQLRNAVNVLDYDYSDDRTMRHAKYFIYGRTGGRKAGRKKGRGEFTDIEMEADGYTHGITIQDHDVSTTAEANFVARRHCAEARLRGWRLTYTLAGHRVLATDARSRAIWAPDTVVDVNDQELPPVVSGPKYVHTVTFSRNPHTTTKIQLCRPEDLVFAEKAA